MIKCVMNVKEVDVVENLHLFFVLMLPVYRFETESIDIYISVFKGFAKNLNLSTQDKCFCFSITVSTVGQLFILDEVVNIISLWLRKELTAQEQYPLDGVNKGVN